MANPWMKKNPFLSLWLSNANAMAGRTRSAGAAATSRQRTQLVDQATRFWTNAWFGTTTTTPQTKSKSKRKSKS